MDKYLGDYDNQKGVLVSFLLLLKVMFIQIEKCPLQPNVRVISSEVSATLKRSWIHKTGGRNGSQKSVEGRGWEE